MAHVAKKLYMTASATHCMVLYMGLSNNTTRGDAACRQPPRVYRLRGVKPLEKHACDIPTHVGGAKEDLLQRWVLVKKGWGLVWR